MDVSACYEAMNLMRLLRDEHRKTIVTVLHDIDMALRYSDEICVMREGRLLAQGTPATTTCLMGSRQPSTCASNTCTAGLAAPMRCST